MSGEAITNNISISDAFVAGAQSFPRIPAAHALTRT